MVRRRISQLHEEFKEAVEAYDGGVHYVTVERYEDPGSGPGGIGPVRGGVNVMEGVYYGAEAEGLPVQRVDGFASALDHARERAATVLVTGSFHTVGDAMERLQVDPLAR